MEEPKFGVRFRRREQGRARPAILRSEMASP